MGLRMYNVEFGDGFLLLGQAEHLLVDLGSIDRTVNFDPIRDDIRSLCGSAQLSLVLTHFHKDHWSGLRSQPPAHRLPQVHRIYLPDLFGLRLPGRQDIVAGSLLGELLEAVVLDRKPAFTLAELLRQVLPQTGGHVVLLHRGERFTVDCTEYEVLWPRLEVKDITRRRRAALRRFLERLERGVDLRRGRGCGRRSMTLRTCFCGILQRKWIFPGSWISCPGNCPAMRSSWKERGVWCSECGRCIRQAGGSFRGTCAIMHDPCRRTGTR